MELLTTTSKENKGDIKKYCSMNNIKIKFSKKLKEERFWKFDVPNEKIKNLINFLKTFE